MHKYRNLSIVSLMLITVLVSCQKEVKPDSPLPSPGKEVQIATISVVTSPIKPSNKSTPIPTFQFATSQPNFATIHGKIEVLNPTTAAPKPDGIYLVPVHADGMTIPQVIPGEMPQAEVNEVTGEFVFTNVKPGAYALTVITIIDVQLSVRSAENNHPVILTIGESHIDQTVELGTVQVY